MLPNFELRHFVYKDSGLMPVLKRKMFVPCEGTEVSFKDFTLILPAVSIGNVGQLAVDVLVYNLALKKIGYLYDASILPLVGNDPFTKHGEGEGDLVTSAEVYKSDQKRLVVVQQRAPIVKGCRQIYCQRIIQWIKECQFKNTILLTSCLASERLDSQIQTGPFRYMLTPSAQHFDETFQKMGWKQLEERKNISESLSQESDDSIFLPGGGISKRFHQTCSKEKVPLVMLLVFCAEGDNIPDAMILVRYVNDWLQLLETNTKNDTSKELSSSQVLWTQPPSWQNMYGTTRFSSLF